MKGGLDVRQPAADRLADQQTVRLLCAGMLGDIAAVLAKAWLQSSGGPAEVADLA